MAMTLTQIIWGMKMSKKAANFMMTYGLSACLLLSSVACAINLSQWNIKEATGYGAMALAYFSIQLIWYLIEKNQAIAHRSARKKSLPFDEASEDQNELALTRVFKK